MQNYGNDYANLIIWQYKNKPKAKALIENIVNGTQFFDNIENLRSAFSVDLATGEQLRRIGAFIGLPNANDVVNLDDINYRKLLYFKSITNNSQASPYAITTSIFNIFGNNVTAATNYNMQMFYFVNLPNTLLQLAIKYDLLPRPLGVQIAIIDIQNQDLQLTDSFNLNNKYGIDDIGENGIGTFLNTSAILN